MRRERASPVTLERAVHVCRTLDRRILATGTLPIHMRGSAEEYVLRGLPPHGFLRAVLENDLVEAFCRADEDNASAMLAWTSWLHWIVPSLCWGSEERVNDWIAAHRAAACAEHAKGGE